MGLAGSSEAGPCCQPRVGLGLACQSQRNTQDDVETTWNTVSSKHKERTGFRTCIANPFAAFKRVVSETSVQTSPVAAFVAHNESARKIASIASKTTLTSILTIAGSIVGFFGRYPLSIIYEKRGRAHSARRKICGVSAGWCCLPALSRFNLWPHFTPSHFSSFCHERVTYKSC